MGRARTVGVWTQRIAIAAVLAVVVGFAVRIGSTSSQSLDFRDPLVWLASIATGEVVQADASSGEVTARIEVGQPDDSLDVLQHGPDALVLNRTEGQIARVDGSTLAVASTTPVDGAEAGVLLGRGDQARLVTPTHVVAVDPGTGGVGHAVEVPGLAAPVIDDSGTVWALGEGRQLVAVHDTADDVVVDAATRPFALAAANGQAYLLDGAGPDVRSLEPAGPTVGAAHCVGGSGGGAVRGDVSVGGSVDSGRVVVVVDDATGTVHLSDRVADRCTTGVIADGAGLEYGPSVESGGFAYVPVTSTGEIVVVAVDDGSVVSRSTVTAPGNPVELVVKDGTVWFNDPLTAAAGVLDRDGVVTAIDKFREVEVRAETEKPSESVPPPTGPPATSDPGGGAAVSDPAGGGGGSAQGLGSLGDTSGPTQTSRLTGLVADFTYSKRVVEVGETVTFVDRSQGAPTAWTWDFGDGEFSVGPRAEHQWDTVGAYRVTLRIESATGSAAATATIEVVDDDTRTQPTADFRYSAARVEVGSPVQFTDRSTGNPQQLTWDFGDGTTAAGDRVEHTWSSAGNYRVALTASNALGSDTSEAALITVYDRVEQPTASIDASTTRAGVHQTISLASSSTGNPTELRWDFGDGTTGSGATVSHSYANAGTYVVTLVVANSAGRSEAHVEITVDARVVTPVARIVASTTVAETGQTIRFTSLAINDPDRLTWDFGDGSSTESGTTVDHRFSSAGTYLVSLTASNGAGSHTATVGITVLADVPPPVARFDFTPASPVRAGQPVQFTDRSSGSVVTEWRWSWDDGTRDSTLRNPTHVFVDAGEYRVRLTVANGAGDASFETTIRVLPPAPRAEFTWSPGLPNAGQPVQFTDRSRGSSISGWLWDFGDGTTSRERNPTKTYRERGSYDVTLTVTNPGGSTTSAPQRVDVNPRPPVAAFDVRPTTGVTTATAVEFEARTTAGAGVPDRYSWTFSDGRQFSGATVTRTFATPGTYTATLTVSNGGGANTDSHTSAPFTVTVPPPTAGFSVGAQRLAGEPIALTNTSTGAESSAWSAAGGAFSDRTAANPTVTFADAGTYVVALTVTNGGGRSVTRERITVYAPPTAAIDAPVPPIVAGTPFRFTGTATNGDPVWSFSPGTGSSTDGRLVFPAAGAYDVTLTVTNPGGGRATDTIGVTVDPPAPQAQIQALRGGADGEVVLRNVSPVGGPFAAADVTWDFGDGSAAATGNEVRHVFAGDRSHVVRMTVTNITGTDVATVSIPAAPSASVAHTPLVATDTTEVTFTATTSPGVTRQWLVDGVAVPGATGVTFARTFEPGIYDVQVSVGNLWGATLSAADRVVVIGLPG